MQYYFVTGHSPITAVFCVHVWNIQQYLRKYTEYLRKYTAIFKRMVFVTVTSYWQAEWLLYLLGLVVWCKFVDVLKLQSVNVYQIMCVTEGTFKQFRETCSLICNTDAQRYSLIPLFHISSKWTNFFLSFKSARHSWRLSYSNYFNKETISKATSAMLVFELDTKGDSEKVQ